MRSTKLLLTLATVMTVAFSAQAFAAKNPPPPPKPWYTSADIAPAKLAKSIPVCPVPEKAPRYCLI